MKKVISALLISATVGFSGVAAADIVVGVVAPRGALKAMKKWSEFGNYLESKVGDKVTIKPLSPGKLLDEAGDLDYVLANPTQSVVLTESKGAKELATVSKKNGPQFAGVIVAKKGKGISKATDLKGKKVMSLKFKVAAGAYVFQTYHLTKQGVNPHKDFASFKEGKKQDDLVLAVKAGIIDAAFVRSGILEAMAKEGKLNLNDFVIVDQRKGDGLDLVHTTDLYPEWYFLQMPKSAKSMRGKVSAAVLAVTADMQAAKKAKIKGFVKPVSMNNMKLAMKELHIPPYN
jgi:ABC-type phosphate/phosphonate transport system substrate-binding protein